VVVSGGVDDEVVLPKSIQGDADKKSCIRHLLNLSPEQQQNVLNVYKQKEIAGAIRSPAGLFITLTKAAASGSLIVDTPSPTATHASHRLFDDRSDTEESARASLLIWLRDMAEREGLTVEVAAKKFKQEHLLHLLEAA
jgi:hypothetical protein